MFRNDLVDHDYLERVEIYIDPNVNNTGEITTYRVVFMQVLSNLITNACESIIRGANKHGLVNIFAFPEEKDFTDGIRLSVSDNGAGIEPDNLNKIFEKQFSSKGKYGLTGLGLKWCRDAVTSFNGKIYAESKGFGQGATFHFLFPRNIVKK